MGCIVCKPNDKAELSSYYEETCPVDPKLNSFSIALRQHTTSAISSVAEDAAINRSLSCRSLRRATDGILAVSHDARHNLVDLKEDITSNPDLVSFVEDYLQHSDETIRFFEAMNESLGQARETAERTFSDALRCFNVADYQGTLQKLRELKAVENSFTNKLIKELQSVQDRHELVLTNLSRKKKMVDEKLGLSRAWKKVWAIVVPAVCATGAICGFLLTALTMPPVAIAAVALSVTVIGTIKLWIDWLWNNYNKTLKRKKEVISMAERATSHAINELKTVRMLATDLEGRITGIVETAQFAVNEVVEVEAAVNVTMEDMRKKIKAFKKSAKKLENNVNLCIREIRRNKEDIKHFIEEARH